MTKNCMNGLEKMRVYDVNEMSREINKEVVETYTNLFSFMGIFSK